MWNIYSEELAYRILKVGKLQDLQNTLASWDPGEPVDITSLMWEPEKTEELMV